MVPFPGFVGGSNALKARHVNCERSVNWYPSPADGSAKAPSWLRTIPGLTVQGAIVDSHGAATCLAYEEDRVFAIAGTAFTEIFEPSEPGDDSDSTSRGTLVADAGTGPVQIVFNGPGRQLFIVAGGKGYTFNLDTNAFAQITDPQFPSTVIWGGFADGYFIAVGENSTQFSFSSLNDGTAWAALDVMPKSKTTDVILASIFDHGELLLLGRKTTESFYNSGDLRTPWVPRPVPLETGILAPQSLVKGKESLFWIQSSDRGPASVVQASGQSTRTIGNEAVHEAIRSAARPDLARAFFYEDGPHGFYVLTIDASQTWVYDTFTRLWHERLWWNPTTGAYEAYLPQCYVHAWNMHLVGLRVMAPPVFGSASFVCRMDHGTYLEPPTADTPLGSVIRRLRRTPYVQDGGRMLVHDRLELDCATGLEAGLPTDSIFHSDTPSITMAYSDDHAQTWSMPRPASLGSDGQHGRIVSWDTLGRSRHRAYEFVCSDIAFAGISGANLQVRRGLR